MYLITDSFVTIYNSTSLHFIHLTIDSIIASINLAWHHWLSIWHQQVCNLQFASEDTSSTFRLSLWVCEHVIYLTYFILFIDFLILSHLSLYEYFDSLSLLSLLSVRVSCKSLWQHVHSAVEKIFADILTSSIINSFSTISKDIVIIAFDIDSFVKNHHNYVNELSDEIKYIVNVIVIINFQSLIKFQIRIFRIASIESSDFSSE